MAVKPAIKVTYARDWTRSEMIKPASNPEDGAHPATEQ